MRTKTSTDFAEIKQACTRNGEALKRFPYTWGEIQQVHTVGRYDIVEYLEREMNSDNLTQNVRFATYVDGKDCHQSSKTLEGALLLAFDNAVNDVNSRAAFYAAKVLGING
jgi:hypothetical protein